MRATIARRGFTLIELLVVVAIIVALMAMIALAAPRFAERQGPTRGAMQLQSWLNLSRQMAIRDQRPRGIRMLPPAGLTVRDNDKNYSRELVYIEQPDDFAPTPIGGTAELYFPAKLAGGGPMPFNYTGATPPDYTWGVIAAVDPYSTTPPNTIPVMPPDPNATVKIGDILNVTGQGEGVTFPPGGQIGPRRIVNIVDGGVGADPSGKPAHLYFVQLDQPIATPTMNGPPNWFKAHTGQYVIYRQPRPMAGEPVLQLPRDVGIDFSRELHPSEVQGNPAPNSWTGYNWYRFYPKIPTGGGQPLEILFHPNGSVMGPLATNYARICLWVRDVSTDVTDPRQLPPGDNSLITIYTRTGMVASHPIDPSGLTPGPTWNPFRFTQDSLLSGQ